MKFLLLTSVLSVAFNAAAWTIPGGRNATDGVWSVEEINGSEVHTLLTHPQFTKRKPSVFQWHERDTVEDDTGNYFSRCNSPSRQLNEGSTDTANAELDGQCIPGAITRQGLDFYSKSGQSVAYYCNRSSGDRECAVADRQAASALITADCGSYYSGYAWNPYGDMYGYADANNNFCSGPLPTIPFPFSG